MSGNVNAIKCHDYRNHHNVVLMATVALWIPIKWNNVMGWVEGA